MITITRKTHEYNEKRYSKPWIAKVDFSTPDIDFSWGRWVGDEGEAGLLELDCEIGDIIATGQKDYRKPKNSKPTYYLVEEGGVLKEFESKVEAYEHFKLERAQ
jgi:hypothetical protein